MQRRTAVSSTADILSDNLEFYTVYTTLDITYTGDYNDDTQKDFESIIQVIGMRAQPIIINKPLHLDGTTKLLENHQAPSLTGEGWFFKFAFEAPHVYTVEMLKDELNNIVLNAGTIDTKIKKNMEFDKSNTL